LGGKQSEQKGKLVEKLFWFIYNDNNCINRR